MLRKWRLLWIATIGGLPILALAHAILIESTPKQDGTLKSPTTQAVLRFNARIEKRIVRVKVFDADGHEVKLPPLPDDKDGPADRLLIALPKLAAGSYQLQYDVLAADGHITPGLLHFNVAGAATEPATAPSAAHSGTGK